MLCDALGRSESGPLSAHSKAKIKPTDPQELMIAVLTLLAAALLTGYLPARRSSRIDPMIALRHE